MFSMGFRIKGKILGRPLARSRVMTPPLRKPCFTAQNSGHWAEQLYIGSSVLQYAQFPGADYDPPAQGKETQLL